METNTNFQKHKVVSRTHSTSSRSSEDSTSPPSTSDSGSEDDSSNNSSHSSSSAAEEDSSNRNSSSSGSSKTSSSDDSSSSGSSSSSTSSDEEDHGDDVRFENAAHIPIEYFADIPMRMANLHLIAGHGQRGIVKEWSTQLGCWVSRQTMVLMFHKAFARGCMRSSYHLIDLQCPSKNFVAKQYRKKTVVPSQYFDDVAMHSIAEYWALQFNTAGAPKRVRFVPAAVLELPFLSPPLIFAIEPHLVGEFKKHNNNNGYVAEDKRNTPQAFSHYTFHKSQGQLLIVDIQGVGDDYTDPQIMSLDGEGYGRGNLGTKGMEKFLKTHQCNAVCEHLALPRISSKNVRVNKAGEPKQHRKKKPKAKHSPKQGVAGSGGSPKLPKVTSTEFPTPRSGRKPPRHTPKRQTSAADDLCNVSTPTTSTENMARLHDDVTMGNPSP
ncbi:myosin heavy chain kinase c-like protein, putative, partial [Bodo saltans]